MESGQIINIGFVSAIACSRDTLAKLRSQLRHAAAPAHVIDPGVCPSHKHTHSNTHLVVVPSLCVDEGKCIQAVHEMAAGLVSSSLEH